MDRHIRSLKRRPAQFEAKRRFILFCEGSNTEPAYFEALRIHCNQILLTIDIVGPAGTPYTIAETAIKFRRNSGLSRGKKKLNSYEKDDQIWAVFDRDEHPRYEEAVSLCTASGISVARSNPCFEVWLILHETDYDRPSGRHEVQAHLRRLRPEYDPSGSKLPSCAELLARLDDAENRADAMLRRRVDEGMPYGPPSTTVFELTRAIRIAADKMTPNGVLVSRDRR
jgi:hypothetical protein